VKRPELPGPDCDLECITEPVAFTPPPLVQGELFDGGLNQVLNMVPELVDRAKKKPARIRRLAKALGIDEKAARKLYEQAIQIHDHREAYQRYLRCKEYWDWRRSPEAGIEIERYRAEMDELFRRAAEVPVRHYVEIHHVDQEVARLLDSGFWDAGGGYYGPMDWLVDMGVITRKDVEVLLKRGYLRVTKGHQETLLTDYDYPVTIGRDRRAQPIRCSECKTVLDYNIVGINHKLGRTEEAYYRCLTCLGLSEEQAYSIIGRYKSSGCPLFV
jgi:hypothetical protein